MESTLIHCVFLRVDTNSYMKILGDVTEFFNKSLNPSDAHMMCVGKTLVMSKVVKLGYRLPLLIKIW